MYFINRSDITSFLVKTASKKVVIAIPMEGNLGGIDGSNPERRVFIKQKTAGLPRRFFTSLSSIYNLLSYSFQEHRSSQ